MSHKYLQNTKSWWEKQISNVQIVRLSDNRKILATVKTSTLSQEQHQKTWSLSSTQVQTWEDEGKMLLENENKQTLEINTTTKINWKPLKWGTFLYKQQDLYKEKKCC